MNGDDQTPFLEIDPPHWAARGLAYILIALFAATALATILIRIPETVTGPFVLVPLQGTDPVRAPQEGIVAAVRAEEGATVRKGDPVFIIQSQTVADRSSELSTIRMQLEGAEEKLTNARMKFENQHLADLEEEKREKGRLEYLNRMMDLKKKQLLLSKELVDSYEKLYKDGIMNRTEYTNHQLESDKIALELQELETEHAGTEGGMQKLQHESQARLADYKSLQQGIEQEIDGNRIRMEVLQKELVHSQGNEVTVSAPCAGTVLALRIKSPGAVVQQGETLCELGCSGERLQAEVTIPESGVMRIRPGHGVKLLYDAFPYQRYGVRYGNVRWVSPASVLQNSVPVFHVLVEPREEVVMIKGQPRPLMPGMGGTAQVVVDQRSLISYAFAPIRQLKEMLAKPPEKNLSP